jgi:hypothetical protein
MTICSHKFEDADLQRRLISGLQELVSAPAHRVESDGTVSFDRSDYPGMNEVIHPIRRSCFRWYLRWSEDPVWSSAFWEAMKRSGTPFQIEYHNGRIAFLLPRELEAFHEELVYRTTEECYPFEDE